MYDLKDIEIHEKDETEPTLTQAMVDQVKQTCHRWRPLEATKPMKRQMVDRRYDIIDGVARARVGTFYFQFEDDTSFVTTARFDGERLIEVYHHPEYMSMDIQKEIDMGQIPIDTIGHYYMSFSPKGDEEFFNVYMPLKKGSTKWVVDRFPFMSKFGPVEEDDFIIRFGASMTPDTIYYLPKFEPDGSCLIFYIGMDGEPRAVLVGEPYDLGKIWRP
jgi:hypothetical protein